MKILTNRQKLLPNSLTVSKVLDFCNIRKVEKPSKKLPCRFQRGLLNRQEEGRICLVQNTFFREIIFWH